jgi:predicted DNA-binding protein with PD1-like motif
MPALSKTPDHAAFYSETFRPAGVTRLSGGALTFGIRDGQPFFHCHALWSEADGRRNGGHILPDETTVAETFRVEAIGLDGAAFTAEVDPETNFKLFGPVARPSAATRADRRVFAMRLRPNRDMAGLVEEFCREHGIARAKLHGGVGSTIGVRFDDGRSVEPFATEVAVRSGVIAPGADGALEAEIDVALVDYTGGLAEGWLKRGDNPVLMTMELVLEAV